MKNRSYRNSEVITDAMAVFQGKQLITKRSEGMSYEDYKLIRQHQNFALKLLFHKGHSPNRRLSGIMGNNFNSGRTQKGSIRRVTQRRAS